MPYREQRDSDDVLPGTQIESRWGRDRARGDRASESEVGLFVVWPAARNQETRIISHLRDRFELLGVYEVHWSPHHISRNYSRFYRVSAQPPFRSSLPHYKGEGPFLVILARDLRPVYAPRDTLKGVRTVSAGFFDAKMAFRDWTGGGVKVHASDGRPEAERDFALLFGCPIGEYLAAATGPWDGEVRVVHRDLPGTDGWDSVRQIFEVLNPLTPYVVLRNFEALPDELFEGQHRDVDILTGDYEETVALLNARPLLKAVPRWGGRFWVAVGDSDVLFDLRFPGDFYYDTRWCHRILENRRFHPGGFYIPNPEDYFETLLYHALTHKPRMSQDYADRLASMAGELGRVEWSGESLLDRRRAKAGLDDILTSRGFRYTRPKDASVYFNYRVAGRSLPRIRRVGSALRKRWQAAWAKLVRYPFRYLRLSTRERILREVPGLRRLSSGA